LVDMPEVKPVLTQQPEVQLDSSIFRRGDALSTGAGMQALAQGLNAYGEAQVKSKIAGIEQTGKLGSMAIGALGSLAGKMQEKSNDFSMTFQRDSEGNLQPISGSGGDFGGFNLTGMLGGGSSSWFGAPDANETSGANPQGAKASEAYGHAITVTNKAAAQTIINENINNLRNKYERDPDQFQVAVGKYADSFLQQGYPEGVGESMWSHAVQVGSQHHISLVNNKREMDLHNGYNDLLTRNGDLKNDLSNVSFGTPADKPDFIEKTPEYAAYKQNLIELQSNPYFKSTYTPARVEHELNMTKQEALNSWAQGNVQRIRDQPGGGIDKATEWARKNILEAKGPLSPEQRESAFNNAVNKITSLTDEQKTKKQAAVSQADGLSELYSKGIPANEQQFNEAYNEAMNNFAPEAAAKLRASRNLYEMYFKPAGGLSPQQGAASLMGPQPQSTAGINFSSAQGVKKFFEAKGWTPHQAAAIAGAFSQESRFNPNAINPHDGRDGSDSIGIAQWNGQRAQNLKAFAASRGKPWNDLETQLEFVHHELTRGSEFSAGTALRSAGDVTSAASAMAGYERPRGWSPQHPELSDGWANRLNTASRLHGGGDIALGNHGVSQGGAPVAYGRNSALPFTAQQMHENPWLASQAVKFAAADNAATVSYAKEQMNVAGEGFKFGIVPTPEKLAELKQIADTHPKELGEEYTKLQAKADAAPMALAAAGYPGGGEQLKAQTDKLAAENPDFYHMKLAEAVREQVDGRAKQIKEDPHAYAARKDVNWTTRAPTPFSAMGAPQQFGENVTPLDVFKGTLMQHRQSGIALLNHGVTNDIAAATFPDKAINDMGAYLSSASPQQAEAFAAGLKNDLNDKEYERIAGNKQFANVVAGLTRSGDPQKVTAGYMLMERAYGLNPFVFDKEHPGQRERMTYWNTAVRFMGYDEAKRVLMQDAQSAGSDQVMTNKRKEVRETLKNEDTSSVLKAVTGSWFTPASPTTPKDIDLGSAQVLTQNWKRMVENYYVAGNDMATSKSNATDTLKKYYGVSAFNGGEVMLIPPENVYKTPQEMMAFKGSFNAFVIEKSLESGVHVDGSDASLAHVQLDAKILSDAQTLDSVASRQPPSYAVQIKDPKTGHTHLLMDANGMPVRFPPKDMNGNVMDPMQDPMFGKEAMQNMDMNFYKTYPRWKRAMERGPMELFKGPLTLGANNGG